MKKYILFCIESYYPSGGLDDIEGSFDTLEDAIADLSPGDRCYVVDRDTWGKVWERRSVWLQGGPLHSQRIANVSSRYIEGLDPETGHIARYEVIDGAGHFLGIFAPVAPGPDEVYGR